MDPATVTMTACEDLPQELIIAIVDNLQDDKKSLHAFSLVCKAWTNPARDHLFASLGISSLEGLEKIKAANITSTYTPFLRRLSLASFRYHDQFWHELILFLADFSIPRLQSLALSNFAWPSLSQNKRSAFLRRFQSIVSLRLSLYQQDTPNDIPTIICSFPHLRKLFLHPNFHMRELSEPSLVSLLPPEYRLPERLSTLRISYFDEDYRLVLHWLGSIPEQLSIHTFDITLRHFPPHYVGTVNVFLKALGPSLEVFGCNSHKYPPIDLTCNTRLRCISFDFFRSKHDSEQVLSAMHILSRIGSRVFAEVGFRFRISSWGRREFPTSEWIQMDTMLASPQFAALKDVCIYARPYPLGVTDLQALFATLLPICYARGLVSFVDQAWRGIQDDM